MATAAPSPATFAHDHFLVRRKIFALANQFSLHDPQGNLIGYSKQKMFKLKEDIRIYTDQSMTRELVLIKARQILDWSAAYDVMDAFSGQKVGALKRKGWKSVLRDEWIIMDTADQEIGRIREDSALLATIRRFVTNIIPQSYNFELRGQTIGTANQNWNFFAPKMDVDLSQDITRSLDRRLAAAAVILLMAIEGRQQ